MKSAHIINTQLDELSESWRKVGILDPEGIWSLSLLLCPPQSTAWVSERLGTGGLA